MNLFDIKKSCQINQIWFSKEGILILPVQEKHLGNFKDLPYLLGTPETRRIRDPIDEDQYGASKDHIRIHKIFEE